MTSPTQRTLKAWRATGWTCFITEKWNPHARVRQDAFGFGDVLVISPAPKEEIALIQSCAGASHAARRKKILAEPRALAWIRAGGKVYVSSWSKRGGRGERKLWTEKVEELTETDFSPNPPRERTP